MSSSSTANDTLHFFKLKSTDDYTGVHDVLRALCVLKDPEDNEKYEKIFLMNDEVWDLLKDSIDVLYGASSPRQLAQWLAYDGSWEQLERRQINGVRHRDSDSRNFVFVKNINAYRAFSHVDAEKWVIVGYARKSVSKKDDSTRQRLLTDMVTKLKTKLVCRKVFVSPCSSADMEFSKRDKNLKAAKLVESLKCDGTTQDLLVYLQSETRMVRLLVIDYAGLSTNVEGLRSLVSNRKCIKEVVIDKGHRVEVITRKQLLKKDKVLRLFRCRTKAVNRSN